MIFRFRYVVAGGHTHVRLFAGGTREPVIGEWKTATLGKCGDLCFRNEEWQAFMDVVNRFGATQLPGSTAAVQFVDDTEVDEDDSQGGT